MAWRGAGHICTVMQLELTEPARRPRSMCVHHVWECLCGFTTRLTQELLLECVNRDCSTLNLPGRGRSVQVLCVFSSVTGWVTPDPRVQTDLAGPRPRTQIISSPVKTHRIIGLFPPNNSWWWNSKPPLLIKTHTGVELSHMSDIYTWLRTWPDKIIKAFDLHFDFNTDDPWLHSDLILKTWNT